MRGGRLGNYQTLGQWFHGSSPRIVSRVIYPWYRSTSLSTKEVNIQHEISREADWVEDRCGRQTWSVWCVLCAQSSSISKEEGKKQMAGLPACLAFVCAKKWEKCLHSLVCLCVWALLSSSPPSPIPSRLGWKLLPRNKSRRDYITRSHPRRPTAATAACQWQYGNGTRYPCEVHAGE